MNNNNNLVTVIIPTYNSSKFIIETLDSVVNQTYKNYEIIIIDDCSTDNTVYIVENHLKNFDLKYKILTSYSNQGVAVARNRGIKESSGKYIAFLDSDDLWVEDKLEKQINFMNKNNYYFSYTNQLTINDKSQVVKNKNKIKSIVTYKVLLKRTYISTSSVIVDISEMGKFQMPNYRRGQDYATWIMLLRKLNAYGLDERLLKYRVSNGSLSSNKLDNLRQIYTIQREQEGLKRIRVLYNLFIYLLYGINKTFFKR